MLIAHKSKSTCKFNMSLCFSFFHSFFSFFVALARDSPMIYADVFRAPTNWREREENRGDYRKIIN